MKRREKSKEEKSLKEKLLFFFFPPKCAVCQRAGYENLCPDCREKMEEAFHAKKFLSYGGNGFVDEMISLFPYENRCVRRLLFDWKQNDYRDLHEIFGGFSHRAIERMHLAEKVDLVTFLPRRAGARRKAGFDQARCLAEEIARREQLPFEALLKRRGLSRPQHHLSGEQREKNVAGRFTATRALWGETILLVDDIVTSGASAREGARILKRAGAMKVIVFSLAHPDLGE